MSAELLEKHFARTGVDPLTAAFGPLVDEPRRARHGAAPEAKTIEPDPAAVERLANLKAAMPAHALRLFEAWRAAPENSPARADLEATMPAHALRALATLAAAARQAREDRGGGVVARATPDWAGVVAETDAEPARPVALYAHFPFCAARCAFCPFYRYADPEDWRPYRDALLREVELAAAPFAKTPPISAVYFGGGTPSDLPGDALASLVEAMRGRFSVSAAAEITVEGRPSTLDPEKVARLRAAGVNRFSLGVQTFDGEVRRAMGRRLGDGELLPRLREIARAADEAPVIIDLIYGLPGQTDASWERDLDRVIAEDVVAGLDLYRLKVFPGSPLARLAEAGRAEPASDKVMARRFARGVARLKGAGFHRLSRWHWARDERERSVYNRLAKGAGDIIPLGCGAGGRWRGRDFVNPPALATWQGQIAEGRKTCAGRGEKAELWRESLSAQIEACRLDPFGWHGASPEAVSAALRLLEQWSDAGLTEPSGLAWRLTLAGQYWSDRLLHSLQTVLGG